MKAIDVMTKPVVSVCPDAKVQDIARLLLKHHISAVPVIDDHDRVIGIVSEGDLMRRAETGTDERHSWWLSLVADLRADAFVKSHGLHAKDVMTREVISVSEDTPLDEVATLLERHRIKRVPVVRDGKLAGIVSRANLLHGLVALQAGTAPSGGDRGVRAAIMDTLMRAGIHGHFLNVVVSNGVVHLWGAARSESERDAVHIAAEAVPGVKRIENHLFVISARLRGALGGE